MCNVLGDKGQRHPHPEAKPPEIFVGPRAPKIHNEKLVGVEDRSSADVKICSDNFSLCFEYWLILLSNLSKFALFGFKKYKYSIVK